MIVDHIFAHQQVYYFNDLYSNLDEISTIECIESKRYYDEKGKTKYTRI